jgi:type I restriction-modification system DNA methylase subunit
MLLSYKDYLTQWDELAAIFSRDAVLRGSFDKYAEGLKGKKGTTEVDDAFLEEMEHWRDLLARNLALRNPDLQIHELNYAVQMTIDRIVFLRICEDRGIERENQLQELIEGEQVYERLCQLFRQADNRYNSGLFHFSEEKGQSSSADGLTLRLSIDDKALKEIINDLYYPSPYVFNEIPADILGQVYERFLGKVIRLTAGHQAKVEEKPEVRKAGGVYYTPTYIVDYIVKNTVGKLLEGKTPHEAASLKILDPACGSGSFLLGAYQYLLDWHTQWYSEHEPEKWAKAKTPAIYQAQGGDWRLTTTEKKNILLNNIHGVDIDPQAVEVTKLSLSLKVLEGESQESIGAQLGLFKERALPDLGSNIKCGNSLIGPDYYEGRQLAMFEDEEERYRVNPFNWQAAFPQVFTLGGFDAVIGNPPYIRIQAMQEWAPTEVEFYKKQYKAASKGNYDIYVVFVERGLSLLNKNGRLGFILPHKFFNAQYGEPLRGIISSGNHLAKVVHFGDQQVFENATTYTCLMFLDKAGHDEFSFEKVDDLEGWRMNGIYSTGIISATSVTSTVWNFQIGEATGLIKKLERMPIKLGDVASIFVGTQTSADDIFVLDDCELEGKFSIGTSKALGRRVKVESEIVVPFLYGKEIRRYQMTISKSSLICPYEITNKGCRLFDIGELRQFPHAFSYLEENKQALMQRESGRFKGSNWFAFGYPKSMYRFRPLKIIVPDYNNVPSFTYDQNGNFFKTGYGIIVENNSLSPLYILGLLNSKLLFHYLLAIGTTLRGGYVRFWTQFIKNLPVRTIDFSDAADKAFHDKMVLLVQHMLEMHRQSARTPQEKERIKSEIESTDRAIDALVYELYGLTEDEIKIVEGK